MPEQPPAPSLYHLWIIRPTPHAVTCFETRSVVNNRTSVQMACLDQAQSVFLHFFHRGIKMEGGGWGGLRDEGQTEVFDSRPWLLLLPWQKSYLTHVSLRKSLWCGMTIKQIHKDFSHIALQTQPPSRGNIREIFGLPLPLHLFEGSREHSPLSTKI